MENSYMCQPIICDIHGDFFLEAGGTPYNTHNQYKQHLQVVWRL